MSKFSLILSDGKRRIYRKEILRVGQFVAGDVEFELSEGNLHQLKQTFDQMITNGVKVPIPLEHTFEPEKNQGWVVAMDVSGGGLFASMELSDIDDPNLYDVSVYIPQSWTDGEGHVYAQPIRHVALTSYPRITGLGEFQAIVASLVPVTGGETMSFDFKVLGSALGIATEMTEENAQALLLSHRDSLQGEITGLKTKLEDAVKPEPKSFESLKELAASHPNLIKLGTAGRKSKLEALVGVSISPAVRDSLVELFCSEDSMILSLDETESTFEKVATALEKNRLIDLKELTGPQGEALVLSDPSKGGGAISPLVADAQKRAEAAK